MRRNYPVSMVRAGQDHHSAGPWSLKDRTDNDFNSSSGVRNKTVSTHILGLGIVLVGALILAIGLIMGLEFPDYVQSQNKEKQCVVHSEHEKYKSWSLGTQWTRTVRAYYWTLANVDDFLYRAQKPTFVQRGPYVYAQKDIRYEVNFAVTDVTFRLRHQYAYDKEATRALCSSCREHDKLTILSPWYLQMVGQAGGEDALGLINMVKYAANYLSTNGLTYLEDGEVLYSSNISMLGKYESASTLSGQPLVNFSFGAWLNESREPYKALFQNNTPLNPVEVKALYKVITSLTLLGGKALSLPDPALQQNCEEWAQGLCSNLPTKLKPSLNASDCGVIYIFHKCHTDISTKAKDVLHQTFCPPTNGDACLNISNLSDDLLMAYRGAISDFLQHLSNVVLDSVLVSRDIGLVMSRNQSQLALGYDVGGDEVLDTFRATGLLHSNWVGDTSGTRPLWRLYTCLEDRNMNNNMKVKEYNNSRTPPAGLLRSEHRIGVSAFTDFVTSCSTLITCRSCSAPGKSLSFFHEDLLRPVTFTYDTSTSIRDVDVYKYTMDKYTFNSSRHIRLDEGLQDMTDVNGHFSWASFPQVVGADTSHLILDNGPAPSNSFVKVEPATGRVWERNFKVQWNVGISKESALFANRNIAAAERPLPLFWVEKMSMISSDEIGAYKHLITRLMRVSCGGVIGFSVAAIIVVIIGIIICVYPSKPNRVTPMIDDASHNVPNGRYV